VGGRAPSRDLGARGWRHGQEVAGSLPGLLLEGPGARVVAVVACQERENKRTHRVSPSTMRILFKGGGKLNQLTLNRGAINSEEE